MKKGNFKIVRIAAAVVFVFAFLLNIHTNLDGGTSLFGQPLIADDTGTGSGSAPVKCAVLHQIEKPKTGIPLGRYCCRQTNDGVVVEAELKKCEHRGVFQNPFDECSAITCTSGSPCYIGDSNGGTGT
ncbi:hypothetical protein ACFQRK_23550 [Parapedobacter sp. GCM10030251]|uniref:hypothetical protein n=1 Tax=Parapedobacter sp. GCM10030251 TaxID=3273419 RepID=UPI00361C2BE2